MDEDLELLAAVNARLAERQARGEPVQLADVIAELTAALGRPPTGEEVSVASGRG